MNCDGPGDPAFSPHHSKPTELPIGVALGSNQAASYMMTGNVPKRYGNEHPSVVPYQVFATQDGHIIVAVGNDSQWQRRGRN